VGKLNRKRI